jgi:hypothetical protein
MTVASTRKKLSLLISVIALAVTIPTSVVAEAAPQPQLIDASGLPITSVFNGITPDQQIRKTIILKVPLAPSTASLNFQGLAAVSFLGISSGPTGNACPTQSVCGQPGSTSVPGEVCDDQMGCVVDVHNQGSGPDFSQGTFETYQCTTCCIDWQPCTIPTGPPPSPPPNPCLDANVPLGSGPTGQDYSPNCSPIIIDPEAEGFHLTSAKAGVMFDMTGTGHPLQIAWTDPHFHNAFLALPGSDGLVHNGKELFGNFTPQPQSPNPNGFIALAQFDKPESGGNGDGIIDERDPVFSRLRLWIDANHDGVCQPEELHRLPELGIYSLALDYTESPRTDAFGNQFRYKARVNPGGRRDPRDQTPTGDPGRWTYDVFFVVK